MSILALSLWSPIHPWPSRLPACQPTATSHLLHFLSSYRLRVTQGASQPPFTHHYLEQTKHTVIGNKYGRSQYPCFRVTVDSAFMRKTPAIWPNLLVSSISLSCKCKKNVLQKKEKLSRLEGLFVPASTKHIKVCSAFVAWALDPTEGKWIRPLATSS